MGTRLPPRPFLYPVVDAGLLAGRDVGAVVAVLAGAGCSLLQVRAKEPVDYVAVGPVFATRTKARPDPVVGTELVREARRMSDRPLVAIGGIEPGNAADVVRAGADGLAVISALLRAADLAAAVRAFAAALGGAR